MSSEFYKSIIDEEKRSFGIADDKLKAAARVIGSSYSKKSLENGSTKVNYNIPECRCAYLYKYANLHTGIVTKYFRKFWRKKEIRNKFSQSIKICSLGGGPGTDIIGIFKALAVIPYYQNRINHVSVLDICGGWCNTFENIISGLLTGKVTGVPETFVNNKKFKYEFIEVDLLQILPENTVEIISKADIICMTKFISVILANKRCLDSLKVLGNLFKPGATVLFIDNYQGNVFESVQVILKEVGLEVILGPLHEVHVKHSKQQNQEEFGCLAQTAARITVVGLLKKCMQISPETFFFSNDANYSNWNEQEDFISVSVSSDEEGNNGNTESRLNIYCDKFVQTELEDCNSSFTDHIQQGSLQSEVEELSALTETILDLLVVMKKIKKKEHSIHRCCHCHL